MAKNKVLKDEAKNDDKFCQGDLAVYPAHGVGCIESIESKHINGEDLNFYMMKIIENGMVIMIPTANAKAVGLREVIQKDEIQNVLQPCVFRVG